MSKKNEIDINLQYVAKCGWQQELGDDYYAYGYINSYKTAGDILVEEMKPDLLIFPIVFCYRQYLELLLKNIFYKNRQDDCEYNNYVGKVSHSLIKSWEFIKPILQQKEKIKEEKISIIETTIKWFDDNDPYSFSYRFEYDKKNNRNIKGWKTIDTKSLKNQISKIDQILKFTYDN